MATFDQQTAPEIRAAFRERAGKAEYFPVLALHRDHVLALCADADALAGARAECQRLRTAMRDALVALRSGYRSPHPLDFYRGTDPEMHDYVEGRDAARAAKLLADALKTGTEGASE